MHIVSERGFHLVYHAECFFGNDVEKGKLSNKDMQGIRLGNFREFVTVRVFKTYDSMTTF